MGNPSAAKDEAAAAFNSESPISDKGLAMILSRHHKFFGYWTISRGQGPAGALVANAE